MLPNQARYHLRYTSAQPAADPIRGRREVIIQQAGGRCQGFTRFGPRAARGRPRPPCRRRSGRRRRGPLRQAPRRRRGTAGKAAGRRC